MTPFTIVKSVAAHLPEPNIDTDAIYPARYLLLMDREGLGRYLFRDRRFTRGDVPEPSFILNQPPFSSAEILVAGSGFGCGSSREQAVWALLDFGIRCVVAPSFGEIFAGNAAQNGLLALTFDAPTIDRLAQAASRRRVIGIDLVDRVVTVDDRWVAAFAIPDAQRLAMLNGWDATDSILQQDGDAISAFEAEHRRRQPWLFQEDRTALDRGGP